jgi:hypothetical protein
MSTLEINIDEYITEAEKKELAQEAFKEACMLKFKDEDSVKRIISNSAYDIVYRMVDESFNIELEYFLQDRVVELVKNLSEYSLFQKPNAWSRESNSAYQILERTLIDNKELIESTVVEHLPEATIQAIKADLKEYIQDAVNRHYNEVDVHL